MSHFSVLVIGSNVEGQLAPYQENNMGDCPKAFLEFENKSEDLELEYETGTAERVIMPDGRKLSPWDEEFRVPGSVGIGNQTHQVPEGLELREIPIKELMSFEEFVEEEQGYRWDKEEQAYGYWHNPNAKWDWYEEGGRWSDLLQVKPEFRHLYAGKTHVDSLRIGHLDIEEMRNQKEKTAAIDWELFQAIVRGRDIPDWDELREKNADKDLTQVRKEYHEHPVIKELQECQLLRIPWDTHWAKAFCYGDRDKFIQRARNLAFSFFAVVDDGEWYESGDMGWWGSVSDQKEEHVWQEEFNKLLDGLPPETRITVIDCHI